MRVADEIACEAAPDHGPDTNVDQAIKRLLDGQLYGVLCTQGQGQPYGALVAYAMTPDLDSAVFATQKGTRKYRLLSACDQVALVIDNRSAFPGQLMDVEAVTATGRAHKMATGPEFERWSRLLTDRHPHLDTFVRSVSCSLFRIDMVRYFHVTRFQEVRQWVPRSHAEPRRLARFCPRTSSACRRIAPTSAAANGSRAGPSQQRRSTTQRAMFIR